MVCIPDLPIETDSIELPIRQASLHDLAAVVTCADLAFAFRPRDGDDRHVNPDSEHGLQIREGAVHVIGTPELVLGYISFQPNGDHLFVETVAVLPTHQGRGFGSRLLSLAERQATGLDLRSVRLFTDGTKPRNLAFYRRNGYRESGRCDDDGFSRVFFRKDIASRARARQPLRIARR